MSKYSSFAQLLIQRGLISVSFLLTLTACSSVDHPQSSKQANEQTAPVNLTQASQEATLARANKATVARPVRAEVKPNPSIAPTSWQNSSVADFAKKTALDRGIPLAKVQFILGQARYQSTVARLMTPPPPDRAKAVRDWQVYRQRFVEPIRIRGGVAFMQTHAQTLQKAEDIYGVPAELIAAIIGIETLYGSNMGDFKVLDALSTLAFHYPPPIRPDRVKLFQDQLADLIELDMAGKIDASTQLGSFAGAIGIPQFMPGSILRYAVSAQAKQRIDLSNNFDDAILSVANFLVQHGWVKGLAIYAPISAPPDAAKWVDGGLTPYLKWSELEAAGSKPLTASTVAVLAVGAGLAPSKVNVSGVKAPQTLSTVKWQDHLLGVIDLALPKQDTVAYRVGTPNFFVITQYNRSYFYASAVADLAQAINASK
jgi:membrane-bound lytic murein transglycosylase B